LFSPYILLSFLLTFSVIAQDEDLSALEKAINTDPVLSDEPAPRMRWNSTRETKTEVDARNLDLRSIIEEGFRRNALQQIRGQQKEQIELAKTDLFQRFWLPTVSLDLQTSNHRIDRIKRSSQNTTGMGASEAPEGRIGLVIEEYTIFNWGRDYLLYLNQKQTLNRANQQLNEGKRRLKFSLIGQYFNLIRTKEILKIRQEQLRQTSFIHRLAREKLQLRKVKTQEYYQTRSDYLKAQTEYQQASFDVGIEEEEMANLLADDYRGAYRTLEQLRYVPVNTSIEESLKLAQEQSVEYRNAKLAYDNATRYYEKTLKDNLPLPKFSLNLGTYQQNWGADSTQWNYQTTPGNRNIEVVAAIDMRWTIMGEGGFFNSRENQRSFLDKRITEINFYNTRRELEVKIKTIYKTLRFMEQKVDIAVFQYKNAQNNYDSVLDNYIAGRAEYSDIKFAVDNLVIAHINSENVKYDHLLKKLELADFMGLEDFPGENFESLAVR
jgi:outer membrane protein TolC